MWTTFQYCHVERNVFSASECQDIIGMRGAHVSGHLPAARECQLFWLHCANDAAWISDRIDATVARWNNQHYNFELASAQNKVLQMARYDVGERYDWHLDLGLGAMSLRKATLVVELANASEGGGLEIFFGEGRDNRLQMSPGDIAIFPSFIAHRAAPVQRGVRWSLTAWLLGNSPFH